MDKILIAIPTTDYIHARFIESLLLLHDHLTAEGIRHEIAMEAGTLVYLARNRLAAKAVTEGFSHVLWLDSDMVFTEEIVETLMFCKKDMVCGVFQSRRPPFISCIFKDIRMESLERFKTYPAEPFRIGGCGFACVLMKTEVIQKVRDHYGKPFTPMEDYGEDLAFCRRAAALGVEMWCDPTARIGHIAHVPVYPEDHEEAIKARERFGG